MMSGFLVLSYDIVVERGLIRCKRCHLIKKVKILYQLNWGWLGKVALLPVLSPLFPPFYVICTQPGLEAR